MSTAGILIIGNEILSGKVQDENLPFLLPELRRLGVSVERVNVIPDLIDLISQEVRAFSEAFDYVITTGGVGPTHDDVTMDGVAEAFECKLEIQPRMQELLLRALKGKEPNESQLKMCQAPQGARLIETGDLWIPLVACRNVYIFPGIPSLLRKKFESARGEFKGRRFYLRQVFLNCIESDIARNLNELLEEFPDLMLGSYPRMGETGYHTLLTLESREESYVMRALESLLERLPGEHVIRVD